MTYIVVEEDGNKIIESKNKKITIQELRNKAFIEISKRQGLNNLKTNKLNKKLSINQKIGIPNKLEQCNKLLLSSIRDIDIYFYDTKSKQDILVEDFGNDKHCYHTTIHPNVDVKKERLKDIFKLFLSKYGYFIYGKKYTIKLDIQFILAIEKETYNHLHIWVNNMTSDDFKLFNGYMERFFMYFYPNLDIYNKIGDNLQAFLKYITKKDDTIILNEKDFKKGY